MKCLYSCQSADHALSRRRFLGTLAGAFGLGCLTRPTVAKELSTAQKRVLLVFMHGGVSQLETWDPKPATDTGGPFQAIPTSVPGIHISELLPYTAGQMHHLALVRGINTAEDDHGKGATLMETGRRIEPGLQYPQLGAVAAKLLSPAENPLPGYIHVTPRGEGGFSKQDAAFLGPRYGAVRLGDGSPPANLLRPESLSEAADRQRQEMRLRLDERFTRRRRTAETEAYAESYDQAAKVMQQRDIFDTSRICPRDRDRYGTHDFGRHCLLARRLLESGITFVKVTHSNYDTHNENFDFHIEQLGEFDRTFASLLEDLHERGLLETTLVLVLSEFGRTPKINRHLGRDHWSKAWSVALGGCGIRGGVVHGKTNANGTAVTDNEVHSGHLFHTYLTALGLNSAKNHYHQGRPIPMADPKAAPIREILT